MASRRCRLLYAIQWMWPQVRQPGCRLAGWVHAQHSFMHGLHLTAMVVMQPFSPPVCPSLLNCRIPHTAVWLRSLGVQLHWRAGGAAGGRAQR